MKTAGLCFLSIAASCLLCLPGFARSPLSPDAFLERIGETIRVRVSPETGFYEFTDGSDSVFWTEVPFAPIVQNWVAPFCAQHSNMTGKILCTKNNGSDTMLDLTSEYK